MREGVEGGKLGRGEVGGEINGGGNDGEEQRAGVWRVTRVKAR